MLNRWSALALVLGLVGGYAFAAPAARAQTEPVPFSIGDRLTLRYESISDNRSNEFSCTVGAFQGDWVRCDSADPFRPSTSETWRSVKQVIQVTKHRR